MEKVKAEKKIRRAVKTSTIFLLIIIEQFLTWFFLSVVFPGVNSIKVMCPFCYVILCARWYLQEGSYRQIPLIK